MTLYLKRTPVPSIQEHIIRHIDNRKAVGFLEEGTPVLHKGRKAKVNAFVAQDSWQIGISYEDEPLAGSIVLRSEIKPCR